MLSMTVILDSALVSWKVRTMPRFANRYGGTRSIAWPSNST
jgi:hypothetical protein